MCPAACNEIWNILALCARQIILSVPRSGKSWRLPVESIHLNRMPRSIWRGDGYGVHRRIRRIPRAKICEGDPGITAEGRREEGDHSSVLKRDSLSISPHTSHTWSMMAIPADRCSRLFHAQIERGTLFRLKDNALFPVLRGEQCNAWKSNNAYIKLQISAWGWIGEQKKTCTAQAAFIFHNCHLRHIFHFTPFSPF